MTAFSPLKGLYQWKVLPIRMKTSGAVFQRLMENIFEGLQHYKVVMYIDDIPLFSPTIEQHLIDMNLVFERLAKANLKVISTKCVLTKPN